MVRMFPFLKRISIFLSFNRMPDSGYWILDDDEFFYQKGISGSRLDSETIISTPKKALDNVF